MARITEEMRAYVIQCLMHDKLVFTCGCVFEGLEVLNEVVYYGAITRCRASERLGIDTHRMSQQGRPGYSGLVFSGGLNFRYIFNRSIRDPETKIITGLQPCHRKGLWSKTRPHVA